MVIGHEITHGFDDQVSAMTSLRRKYVSLCTDAAAHTGKEFSPYRIGLYCAHCFSSILESIIQNTYTTQYTHPVKSEFYAGMYSRYHASCKATINTEVLYTSNPS
jgi:hypothetical protein